MLWRLDPSALHLSHPHTSTPCIQALTPPPTPILPNTGHLLSHNHIQAVIPPHSTNHPLSDNQRHYGAPDRGPLPVVAPGAAVRLLPGVDALVPGQVGLRGGGEVAELTLERSLTCVRDGIYSAPNIKHMLPFAYFILFTYSLDIPCWISGAFYSE